jgi:hypothetical protein
MLKKYVVICLLAILAISVHAMAARDENLGTSIKDLREKPTIDRNLIKIIGEVANFYDRVGNGDEAKKIRRQLEEGVFVLTPDSEMKSDQGEFNKGKILINKENVDNILSFLSKGGKVGFDRLISLAATIYHENLHAVQSDSTFVIGTIERGLTNNNTRIEQEVWEKTFALQAKWIDTLLKQRDSAQTDAERNEIQKWLDAAVKGWNDYAGEISSHLDTKSGELKDTQWKGPGGITGNMAKGNQKESELWRKFRVWKAGPYKGTGNVKQAAQPVSDEEILKDICRCSTSCAAGSYYSITPVKESPSCEDPSNGPCVCSGYGCMRSVMSPACIARVLENKKGQNTRLNDVLQFIDNYEGKKQSITDPSSVPPIIRKGEAFEMNIKVPGKESEKWLWRSDDAKTFQATRLTPGTGPATETVTLKAPTWGYLMFERSSTQDKIFSVRDLMNGGFVDGIADGLPEGATVAAYVIKDPYPSMPVVINPVATSNKDIVGDWKWINGDVTFNSDGTGRHSAGYTNTWKPSKTSPSTYDVKWSHGYTDTLVLSSDGMTINGTNNEGVKHTATRKISSLPGAGTIPSFTKPDRIDASGSYGLFEPVTTPMTLKGVSFSSYQLQHPGSSGPTSAIYKLNGNASRLTAKAGIDQSLHPDVALGGGATVRITVSGDGKVLFQSNVIDRSTPLLSVDVDLKGVKELVITVDDSGDGNAFDWLVWGDPVIK